MIKINLLGVPRPAVVVMPEGRPPTVARQVVIFAATLLVALGVVYFVHRYWSSQVSALEKQLAAERLRQKELAEVQAQNQRYQQRLQQLQQRINTIQMLQNSRVGPVEMMTMLSNMVNRTDDLYLLSVTPEGGRLSIQGQSNTVESIATFLSALKNSRVFTDVQLRRYYQDDQFNRPSFKFQLDCMYRPSTAAPAASGGSASAPPARRPGT